MTFHRTSLGKVGGPRGELARRLRAARSAAGLTNRELASKIYVSHATLVRAVDGVHLPTLNIVNQFVIGCGVPEDELPQWQLLWEKAERSRAAEKQSPPPDRPTIDTSRPPNGTRPAGVRRVLEPPPVATTIAKRLYRPDPAKISTLDDYVDALRKLKLSAGNPTLDMLARRSYDYFHVSIPRSTLGDLLKHGRRRLSHQLVEMFLVCCGVSGEEDLHLWLDQLEAATYRTQALDWEEPSGGAT